MPFNLRVFSGDRSCSFVALASVILPGGFQTVWSSEGKSNCCPAWSCYPWGPINYGFCFLVCSRNAVMLSVFASVSWLPQSLREVFRLWNWLPSCPVYRGTPEKPSCCGVLGTVVILWCLQLWCQLPWVEEISGDDSGCGIKCSECSKSSDMFQDILSTGEQTS